MRRPQTNPFVPGSDAVPPVWAGRALELADFHDIVVPRRLAGVYERGRIIIGEPGIGKSVLLNRLATEASQSGHWVLPAVRLAAGDDPVARLLGSARTFLEARSTGAALGVAVARLLDRITEVTIPLVGGGVKLASRRSDEGAHVVLSEVLTSLGDLAREEDHLVLVRVDEAQQLAGKPLSRLLTALGDTLNAEIEAVDRAGTSHTRKLPVAAYLSGLPEFYARASAAGATFSRRFKPLELDSLEPEALRLALDPFVTGGWEVLGEEGAVRVHMEIEAAEAIIDAAHGSPFLFQLAGEAVWNAGAGLVITEDEARRGIEGTGRETASHFRLRLQGLSDQQLAYLETVARLPEDERTAGKVAEALGSTSERTASTARALDERHRLIRRDRGQVRFRSPGLEQHLRGER